MKSFVSVTLLFLSLNVLAQDITSIVKSLDATYSKIKDKQVDVEMTIYNLNSGKSKMKKAVLYEKEGEKKLFRYTYPSGDAGIATLSLPNNEIYLYLPMFKKPKKITNIAESNTFNKSDFSISDMSNSGYAAGYNARLISTSAESYKIEFIPKETSPYSKLVMDVDKKNFYPLRTEYYVKGVLNKFALYNHIKVNGLWVANEVSMENVKKNSKTTIKMTNIKLNSGLKDDIFTLENLVPAEK